MKKLFCVKVPKFNIKLSEDISIAKKQVFWRIRNMGQLELEFIVLRWWEENEKKLGLEELNKFTKEVLEKEIPELNTYFVNQPPVISELEYINKIQKTLFYIFILYYINEIINFSYFYFVKSFLPDCIYEF
jgi:succinate dehydrogenase flavin-adding protein (antitoxin of CptAB toxin-antitoxin module)